MSTKSKTETKDVEMTDSTATPATEQAPKTESELTALLQADIVSSLNTLVKGVQQREDRLVSRALRQGLVLRNSLAVRGAAVLLNVARKAQLHALGSPVWSVLEQYLDQQAQQSDMDVETDKKAETTVIPEVEVFLHLLLVIYLIDNKRNNEAAECSTTLINHIFKFSRHTMDQLSARAFFYYSRAFELTGRLAEIRPTLLNALRTASLRHDNLGQTMLLNLLLRNYLTFNLYDQADKLVSKTPLPENVRSNNQLARYFYYLGKIKSVQLEYTTAYNYLQQAIRKAPTQSAKGFLVTVNKLAIVVQLLMGEIPDRSIFRKPLLKQALKPYLQLTKAVRVGDLAAFRAVVEQHAGVFKADKTFTLIQRIRQNVIKTGLKKISLSYSRISLADICEKLHLDNIEDAECIVAKAISDGVIDAKINHQSGYIHSKETYDVYSTNEPSVALHKRAAFCINIHNEAVKAMRYPPDSHKALESEEDRIKRQEEEKEIATALEEDEADEDDEGDEL